MLICLSIILLQIEGLDSMINLETVDLGDNRLKKLENLQNLQQLTEFYCAKNQLTSTDGLQGLTNLTIVAL